ncbi:related to endoglucanase IV [Serendipita indica DSM 11827]|uniref:AA9 family lytic polysaccharide monooxygenase n=1 Tax=Serendipita indica (strain DSM 11827) TaxID=1109443 RepID=G4TGI4_SERID|nr:related to endoglucanase IV [Serendipita indica DSM 11827]
MRLAIALVLGATYVTGVFGHATFQQLWVNGVDQGSYCVRLPQNNNPVTSVTSNDIACNAGAASSSGLCSVKPGDKVTVEIYMAKVSDAKTAVGSSAGWFKVSEMGLASNNPNYYGSQVLNDNCGHYTFTVPNVAPGNYLLRAEVIALHVASSVGGAQFYMTCFQLSVGGSGTGSPSTVKLPGAYGASDPGILYTLWMSSKIYTIPGPSSVYGSTSPTPVTTAYPTKATWSTVLQPTTVPTTPVATSIAGGA